MPTWRPIRRPPEPDAAADLCARHQSIELVNAHPELWPLLNSLTLNSPINWPVVFRQLSKRHTLKRAS